MGLSPNTHRFNQKPVEGDYYPGDGGALQFCFSNTIHNVDMTFLRCYFLQNKTVRNGGALALQTIKRVAIINCTFDENLADYKVDQSAELLYDNYYFLKNNGRGGAIYANPTYSHAAFTSDDCMDDLLIDGCTFNRNKAFDGNAVYIEGVENARTNFVIKNNIFTDYYDEGNLSPNKSVIASEIFNLYDGIVVVILLPTQTPE